MTNPYYERGSSFTGHTLARSETVQAELDAVQAGFALLPNPNSLVGGATIYATDAGVANAYALTLNYTITEYSDGLIVAWAPLYTNTGASTVNLNSLGVKNVTRYNGDVLRAGDLPAGCIVLIGYKGTSFRILGYHAGDSIVTEVAAAVAAAATASSAASTATSKALTATTQAELATNAASTATAKAAAAALSEAAALGYKNAAEALNIPSALSHPNTVSYVNAAGDTWLYGTVTAAGLALLDDADASAQRTTLGLIIGTNIQAYSANLAAVAAVTVTAAGVALLDDVNAEAQRVTLGLVIGTNVQAYSSNLATLASATITTAGYALLDDTSTTAQRTTLGLGSLATASTINNGNWSGTDLAVINGGTGASTAAEARTALGIGSIATRAITIQSGGSPSGGTDGDIWLIY